MRSYGMYDVTRGLTIALAAGLVGLGLWGATQVGTQTTGRFWIAMAVVAAAGFLLTLATHVGTWTKGLRMRVSPTSPSPRSVGGRAGGVARASRHARTWPTRTRGSMSRPEGECRNEGLADTRARRQ